VARNGLSSMETKQWLVKIIKTCWILSTKSPEKFGITVVSGHKYFGPKRLLVMCFSLRKQELTKSKRIDRALTLALDHLATGIGRESNPRLSGL
jgi:hypothetical protein